eukprot:scaffold16305_cov124-Isochrysis_galbana.AAC.2
MKTNFAERGYIAYRGEKNGDDGVGQLLPPCCVRGEEAVRRVSTYHGSPPRPRDCRAPVKAPFNFKKMSKFSVSRLSFLS